MWYKHCQVFFLMYYQPLGSHLTVTRFLKQVSESKPTALGYTQPWDNIRGFIIVGRDLKNSNGCICPKKPNDLLLYLNLDDMISSETLIIFMWGKPLKQSKPGVKQMVVKFTSCPFDLCICVITTPRMYLACTRCKHDDNKALFISSLSQFLEDQLCAGMDKINVELPQPHY